jgi:hypothetical protein
LNKKADFGLFFVLALWRKSHVFPVQAVGQEKITDFHQ